jgi:hypothetical protein
MALAGNTLLNRTEALVRSLPRDECRSCECFLGLLTQLAIDGRENAGRLVAQYGCKTESVHSCLGCDPCPPADVLAEYLQSRQSQLPGSA